MSMTVQQRIEAVHEFLETLKKQPTGAWADQPALIAQAQEQIASVLQELGRATESITQQDDADFRLLFASSPQPMWMYDLETYEYLEVNEAAITRYGYSRAEFLKMRVSDIQIEDATRPRSTTTQERSRPQLSGESRHRLKDGRLIDVEIVLHVLDWAGHRAALVAVQEITERKRAEDALRQANRDLAQIYRVSQTLTATLDLRQVTRRLLQAVTDILSAQGGSVWLWDKERADELVCQAVFHPELEHLLVGLRLRSDQGVVGWVARNGKSALVPYAPDDPRFYPGIDAQTGFHTTSLLTVPLRVRDAIIGVLEVVNRSNGQFNEHDLALAETLAGPAAIAVDNAMLVEALRGFASTLQGRNEELDAFAHTVAHDLKHPLTLLIGFADALIHDYAVLTAEQHQRYLQNILQSGNKMNNILDELMLLGEVRKTGKQSTPLDMTSIVEQAQQRVADMIAQYRAEIILPDADQWPQAMGYGPWVEEVWVNYLSNALKYGGRPPRVELGATSLPNGMIRFWVRDNGNGLGPQDQARVFTPFTRLDQVRAKGHGLGLSIAQRIVEKLGGQVGVESEGLPGRGSLFFFTLPDTARTSRP